jgi:hypothetical protein
MAVISRNGRLFKINGFDGKLSILAIFLLVHANATLSVGPKQQ